MMPIWKRKNFHIKVLCKENQRRRDARKQEQLNAKNSIFHRILSGDEPRSGTG